MPVNEGHVIGADTDITEGLQLLGAVDPEGIEYRKTAGIRMISSLDLIEDRLIDGILNGLTVLGICAAGIHQTSEIHHIGISLISVVGTEGLRSGDLTDHGGQGVCILALLIDILGKCIEGRDHIIQF